MLKSRQTGFTLIELMIVVAIVAILASIAYPSYQDQLRKARRADAESALLENQHWMERNFTISGRYDQKSDGSNVTSADLPVTSSPQDGSTEFYALSLAAVTSSTYSLEAEPQAAQADDTDCATLSINQLGIKGITGTGTVSTCWGS
ncbi:MAG: type IV pilin protein [Gammaproteobacteria bacterium]|nr:type IV pilin protein [Gammaproteobacteria bacterium]